jgi:hypothetical protein
VYELVDLSFQVVRFEVPVLNVIDVVSEPSSHSTQPLTDAGVNGGIYVRFTLFTLEIVLLHMFCDALRVRVEPEKVMFEFPNKPVPPVATVKTLPHPVDPVIETEPPPPPDPGGPVGPVTTDAGPVGPVPNGPVGPVNPVHPCIPWNP